MAIIFSQYCVYNMAKATFTHYFVQYAKLKPHVIKETIQNLNIRVLTYLLSMLLFHLSNLRRQLSFLGIESLLQFLHLLLSLKTNLRTKQVLFTHCQPCLRVYAISSIDCRKVCNTMKSMNLLSRSCQNKHNNMVTFIIRNLKMNRSYSNNNISL